MPTSTEFARQRAFAETTELLNTSPKIGDFAWRVMSRAAVLKGQERDFYIRGVFNALETLAYRENV